MPPVQLLGGLHALILIALSWRSAARLTTGSLYRLSATYLLTWCNLVATGLILSLVSKLNEVALYSSVSLAMAAAVGVILRRRSIVPPATETVSVEPDDRVFDRVLRYVLAGTLVLAAIASAVICLAYVPNNHDSATYRFSRAFFYLAQGNLLHTGNWDPRLSIYPLNGALLYVFPAIYRLSPRWMSLVTYMAWIFTGLSVYVAARSFRASRTGSLVAAWLCCMAPSVLAQATSTNDELLAAVPILLGLVFAREFWLTNLRRYALLAGIGIGLGLGAKLHWVFYSVFLGAMVIVATGRAVRSAEFRSRVARRLPMLFVATIVAASLSTPFMVSNYISLGRITMTEFNDMVLNRPFRLSLALEKIRVNTAELFLSPIPDLVPPIDREQRRAAYIAFNRFFMECCFSDLVETVKRPHPGGSVFQGPATPDGYMFYEYTWLGFLPHLLLLVGAAYALTRMFPLATLVCVLAFFGWHATNAMQTRYHGGSFYYSFAAVLAVAGLGPAWDVVRSSRRAAGRVLLACFFLVFATHLILAVNLLQFGGSRNLQFVWRGAPAPDMHPVDDRVVEAIRAAREVYIPYTRWEVLYWNFMRFNPGARHTTGKDLIGPAPTTLMLLSILPRVDPGVDAGRLPARLPRNTRPGLTYLGRADGDHIFAQGDGVEGRFPDRSRYALLHFTWSRDQRSGAINGLEAVSCCVGVGVDDGVEFRVALSSRITGKSIGRDWAPPGPDPLRIPFPAGESYDTLAIETRGRGHAQETARTVYDLTREFYDVGTDKGS